MYYDTYPTCRKCGCLMSDVEVPICGHYLCSDCAPGMKRLEAWIKKNINASEFARPGEIPVERKTKP